MHEITLNILKMSILFFSFGLFGLCILWYHRISPSLFTSNSLQAPLIVFPYYFFLSNLAAHSLKFYIFKSETSQSTSSFRLHYLVVLCLCITHLFYEYVSVMLNNLNIDASMSNFIASANPSSTAIHAANLKEEKKNSIK